MNDLLRDLRAGSHRARPTTLAGVDHDERCLEAADEIEAQRADIERLERQHAEARLRILSERRTAERCREALAATSDLSGER